MSYVIVSVIILGLLFILRRPIRALFAYGEKVGKTAEYYIDTFCQEVDTNTLNRYNKLRDNKRIDPEARKKLEELFKND